MGLREYRRRRRFDTTAEPRGVRSPRSRAPPRAGPAYVMQKHAAGRLHYDLRLEAGGVLKSWAVPKGPSLDPTVKRLAAEVEDHPLEYATFEGTIPEGEYGAGMVMLWDRGTWEVTGGGDADAALRAGKLHFTLHGERLKGEWLLIRMKRGGGERPQWLLSKIADRHARPGKEGDARGDKAVSVATRRTMAQIGAGKAGVWSRDRAARSSALRAGASRGAAARGHDRSAISAPGNDRAPFGRRDVRSAGTVGGAKKKAAPKGAAKTRGSGPSAAAPGLPEGTKRGTPPRGFSPQLATLVDEPPAGAEWVHEIKFDGYRILAHVSRGAVRLITRRGEDWTHRFPEAAAAVAALDTSDAVLDGELVALKPSGVSDFGALQRSMKEGRTAALVYFVFDLPFHAGHDLRGAPLIERKRVLKDLLSRAPAGATARKRVVYSDHLERPGPEVLREACRMGLEGIISKRGDSLYESRRSGSWIKAKCHNRQELVIAGYTEPQRSRTGFGALLLGHYSEGGLVYAGRVGTGFDERTLKELRRRLEEMEIDKSPFTAPVPRAEARGAHWVRPELVAEVRFTEWTGDGRLRHPSFEGLREDKAAREIVRETPAAGVHGESARKGPAAASDAPSRRRQTIARRGSPRAGRARKATEPADNNEVLGVTISNPQRVLYPEVALTKIALARYYEAVAHAMMPEIEGRPLMLLRCPGGRLSTCFHQKHFTDAPPPGLRAVQVRETGKVAPYVVVERPEGIISLAQRGVLEFHAWGAAAPDLEHPDRLIFDLDPGPGVAWPVLARTAILLRERLKRHGLRSFVKTTGGKGVHVVAPLRPKAGWDEVKEFARRIAAGLEAADPATYVINPLKAKREKRVFIDYLRNARGATSIVAYSTRARQGATVSAPISWKELEEAKSLPVFDTASMPARLAQQRRGPWAQLSTAARPLPSGSPTRTRGKG